MALDPNLFNAEDFENDEVASWNIPCGLCGEPMSYVGHNSWECMACGNTGYLTDDGTMRYEQESDDDYDEYYEDIPEGCKSCGGDYPNCADGCELMSD